MGGNSIEVTLISIVNGLYRCVATKSLMNIGGDRFTDIVVDILCEEFIRFFRILIIFFIFKLVKIF
jgi:molecular chaperone DnaK (HSP70)